MPKVIIAACRTHPILSESNAALADALQKTGFQVDILCWNEDDIHAFSDSDMVLLRQTWDYQDDAGGFAAWAARLEQLGCRMENAPELAIWNNDKRTLREFTNAGIHVPATCDIAAHPPDRYFGTLGTDRIVLKPAFGGSGNGVRVCSRENFSAELSAARREAPGRPFIAQEFLPEIAEGEWKLTCIDGAVAFAVHAIPGPDEFRINTRFNPRITVTRPPAAAIEAAETIMAWIGRPLLYCRIDGVMGADEFICTEVELTDPDLHLHLFDGAPERMANAVQRYL